MSEFAFELALCSHLERERNGVVARQLGGGVHDPGGRVLDTVVVTAGAEFDQRASITDRTIPDVVIESDVGPGRFRRASAAIDVSPERTQRIVDHAVELGVFERRRIDGQDHVRQVSRYPERWFGDIIAIENKPDLGRPGGLETQLRTDVSLAVADRVVLATESHVTGAHRNRIPEEVGIWRVHRDESAAAEDSSVPGGISIEVLREADPLPVDQLGTELLDRQPGRVEIDIATADQKARARRRIAERAYGKGWRTYDWPDCEEMTPAADGRPYCAWADQIVDPAVDCGTDCPGHDPADSPPTDTERLRDERSPWVADPDGRVRRQAGLDRFR